MADRTDDEQQRGGCYRSQLSPTLTWAGNREPVAEAGGLSNDLVLQP
jgi:hypothetical protein